MSCVIGDPNCPYRFGNTPEDAQLDAFGHWLEGDGAAWLPLARDVIEIAANRRRDLCINSFADGLREGLLRRGFRDASE